MPAVGQRYYTPDPFEFDRNGVPLAAGRLYFFLNNTATPLDTWSDPGLATPNPNPIVADANGRFGAIFLSPSQAYTVQLNTAATPDNPDGTQIWSEPNVGPAAGGVPSNIAGIIGEVRAFAGLATSIPSGWQACFGQALSRTTYTDLFAVIGTTWGAGDLSTTFNLPDFRGRGLFGKDDMGGTPVNRITSGGSGISGVTLGAVGGDQNAQTDTLTSEAISVGTDSGHSHDAVDGSFACNVSDGSGTYTLGVDVADSVGRDENSTQTAKANISVVTTVTTTSSLTGASQNMPPAAIVLFIIYSG